MAEEAHIVQEAAHAVEATGGIGTLGINLKIFIAQLVNFLIVVLVMWKWAYKPIVSLLDERKAKVETSLKQAKDIEARVEKIEEERADIITAAKQEATEILKASRAQAEEQKTEMVAKAKREVERVIVHGKAQLQAEKQTMLREAKKDLVEIIVTGTQKILKDGIDENKSRSLAEEVVRKMT